MAQGRSWAERKPASWRSLNQRGHHLVQRALVLEDRLVLLVEIKADFGFSQPLLLIEIQEISSQLRCSVKSTEDFDHLLTNFGGDFLAVTALASWLVLVQRVLQVDELAIRNVLDLLPLDRD